MTTITEVYHAFADSVHRILNRDWRPATEGQANDFCSLAIAGESLRRKCEAYYEEEDGPQPYAFETLAIYDKFLANYTGETPAEHLEVDMNEVLAELTAYASIKPSERPKDDIDLSSGVLLLHELEQILMIAAACWRARRALEEQVVIKMSVDAWAHVRHLSPYLQDLSQYAEDYELMNGDDPYFISLYNFWKELADFAPSSLAMANMIRQLARRERIIEKVMKRWEERDKKDKP